MAHLRQHKRSPYWYLRKRNLDTGVWEEESTGLRVDDDKETRSAQKMAEKATAKEAQVAPAKESGDFKAWVPSYLLNHYKNANTLKRYQNAWLTVSLWLTENGFRNPRQIRYQHAEQFMKWRVASGAKHNTARLEFKFFSFLLNEAIRREYCENNPFAQAKVERHAVAEKPEITDEMFKKARAAFAAPEIENKWMPIVFEIMAHIGCRFAESSIPMERLDFENDIITMEDSKRDPADPRKLFRVPMPPQIKPMLERLRDDGNARTVPPLTGEMNFRFNYVLKAAVGATSHSLRVSFITRCHRAGLTESEAMALVNHSSKMVHRIYSRLNIEDARKAMLRVPPPPPL